MSKAESPVPVGAMLADKYLVERTLGVGAMGVVLAGRHVALDQKVAIKFLLPEHRADTDLMARFTREARLLAKLRSPHVARVFDVGTIDDGTPYIVMEYLEGSDLAEIIRARGVVAPALATAWVLQICEAVVEAHAAGIVHRDLKPANVFLATIANDRTVVKVLDFGIAKSLTIAGDTLALTQKGGLLGSPLYMAPEQLNAHDVDPRTDVWAIGVILYELVTGQPPFMADSLGGLVAAIQGAPPNAAHLDSAAVPASLRGVIAKCLAKDRAERFPSADDLAAALTALDVSSGAARSDPPAKPAALPSGDAGPSSSTRSTRSPYAESVVVAPGRATRAVRRRENVFIGGSVVVGLALVALIGVLYVRRQTPPEPVNAGAVTLTSSAPAHGSSPFASASAPPPALPSAHLSASAASSVAAAPPSAPAASPPSVRTSLLRPTVAASGAVDAGTPSGTSVSPTETSVRPPPPIQLK